jgi:amino acid transporter
MPGKSSTMKDEIDFIIIERRIKLLGLIIVIGIILIYILGLLIPVESSLDDLYALNLGTLIIALVLCPASVYIKNAMLKNLSYENLMNRFFNAHIIAFAVCDFGGLICITTNLFINENILFATIGLAVSLVCIYFIFPKERKTS